MQYNADRPSFWPALLTPLLLALATGAAKAAAIDSMRLRQLAAQHVESMARNAHPDAQARVEIGDIDPRLRLPECSEPRFALPPSARIWGSGHLAVRCVAPSEWTLYLTYRIQLRGPGLITRRPLAARAPLATTDLEGAVIEYEQDPGLYPRDPGDLAGSQTTRPLAQGVALRLDMLRRPPAVRSGQKVRLFSEGTGFTVTQEGVAQQTVAMGEMVKVRLGNGRIVHGVVQRDGSVQVSP